MRRKIEWYQEVLALEPGSRVFFPLAKLFAEFGQLEDAERTLRMGLDRHPDVLEARLLLIEVLTRLEKTEDAREQTLLAIKPLERYPAFWTHWAREHAESDRDFAMFLMLVASQFTDKPARWSDVLLEGLHSFTERLSEPLAPASRKIRAKAPPRAPHAAPQPQAHQAQAASSAQSGAPSVLSSSLSQSAAILSSAPAFDPRPEPDPDFDTPYVAPSYVAPAYSGPASQDPAADISVPAAAFAAAAAASAVTGQPGPASWSMPQAAPAAPAAGEPARTGCAAGHDGGLDAPYEGPAPDAKSFRTRTMAELLASQGDFGGALGIYRELWGRSHDAQEKAELTSRIKRLEEDLAITPVPDAQPKIEPQDDPFGKHAKNRLMSTLEALAARLEARVQV